MYKLKSHSGHFKKIIVWTGIIALISHFFLIAVYLTDGRFTPEKINRITDWYARPLFHQSWKIFAPEPPLWNVSLVYRCQFKEGDWSKWKDPGYHWLLKHNSNRLSYYGKMHGIQTRIARDLYNKINYSSHDEKVFSGWTENDFNKIAGTREYMLAEEYLQKISMEDYPGKKIKTIQFAYVAVFPIKFEDRKKENPEKKIRVLKFPQTSFKE